MKVKGNNPTKSRLCTAVSAEPADQIVRLYLTTLLPDSH